jgi:hypothetical protein
MKSENITKNIYFVSDYYDRCAVLTISAGLCDTCFCSRYTNCVREIPCVLKGEPQGETHLREIKHVVYFKKEVEVQ